jgi:hypothetical protein
MFVNNILKLQSEQLSSVEGVVILGKWMTWDLLACRFTCDPLHKTMTGSPIHIYERKACWVCRHLSLCCFSFYISSFISL